MSKGFVILGIVGMMLAGCSSLDEHSHRGIVAELDGNMLTNSDLNAITRGLHGEDSAQVAEQYIYQWAADILQYKEAYRHKSNEIERMVEDYRRELYLKEYQRKEVLHRMDRTMPDSLVERFYELHRSRYILPDEIVMGALIIVPKGTPKQDQLRKMLRKIDDESQLEQLEKYAFQYATGYELFIDRWRTGNEILVRIPMELETFRRELKKGHIIETADSVATYYLRVTDCQKRGEPMPMDYARKDIEKVLLVSRELEYIEDERKKLYNEALLLNKLKIYENESNED